MKSAQAHRSFPTSGCNDLLLFGLLLPGPHRCADEVFANLPFDVRLPRSEDPQNSLPSPQLAPQPLAAFACSAVYVSQMRPAWCVIWWRWRWRWRRTEGAVITA